MKAIEFGRYEVNKSRKNYPKAFITASNPLLRALGTIIENVITNS